jgi:phytoene/squalene synthetase
VVNRFNIEAELIERFMESMETDLNRSEHNEDTYGQYILGSAEVVGLMCLRVFTDNDDELYAKLKGPAMKLGSAFQKVNFLRDLKDDYQALGRIYFPGVDMHSFSEADKMKIEHDIDTDFREAYEGILLLPKTSRFGVYMAYIYYKALFNKIRSVPSARIMMERVRISNRRKIGLLVTSYFKHSFSMR